MEIFMKQAEKDKPIATTPKGVWEASRADEKNVGQVKPLPALIFNKMVTLKSKADGFAFSIWQTAASLLTG